MVTETQVLDAMRHIIDPDLGKDIVSLGFIKGIQIKDGHVSFRVELTTPACPVKEQFKTACEEAVGRLEGVESVAVEMGAQERAKRPAAQGPNHLETVNSIIAVSSCKGGVGKSTVAAHLARAMQREGLKVGLLDADIYGPSVPTLFDLHRAQVFVRGQTLLPVESEGLRIMSMGFLLGESPAVMRGPIVSNYLSQIMRQTEWGELDYLVIDLPPGTGDVQLTIVQQAALDGAIIVTTPQTLSLVDVAKGILMFEKVSVPVLGVVENMSRFTCDQCDKVHYPFGRSRGSLQERFGLPTLAELPITPGLSDFGAPMQPEEAAALDELAEQVHRAIGKQRAGGQERPEVTKEEREVVVRYPDGFEARIDMRDLRAACPCALCVDETTGVRTLDIASIPEDIEVEGSQPLGNYAIAINWSDGHSSGIYSWDYLRHLAEKNVTADMLQREMAAQRAEV